MLCYYLTAIKIVYSFDGGGVDFRRQNSPSKDDPRAEMVKSIVTYVESGC